MDQCWKVLRIPYSGSWIVPFIMAVALIWYNIELGRNDGKTTAPAKNQYIPPILFCFFLAKLDKRGRGADVQLFETKSKTSMILLITWHLFFFNIVMFEILRVTRDNIRKFLWEKKVSQMIENCLIWRKKAKKNFGGSGGSAAVSSQFHIVLHKSNWCAKF